jgi:hypothetical protein
VAIVPHDGCGTINRSQKIPHSAIILRIDDRTPRLTNDAHTIATRAH